MKKVNNTQLSFLVAAIVIGFLLNRSNCITEEDGDSDPLRGGASTGCDNGTISQWMIKSIGIGALLIIGSTFGKADLKKNENLKKFLESEGLKYAVRTIDEEWKVEEQKNKEEMKKMLASFKENEKKRRLSRGEFPE